MLLFENWNNFWNTWRNLEVSSLNVSPILRCFVSWTNNWMKCSKRLTRVAILIWETRIFNLHLLRLLIFSKEEASDKKMAAEKKERRPRTPAESNFVTAPPHRKGWPLFPRQPASYYTVVRYHPRSICMRPLHLLSSSTALLGRKANRWRRDHQPTAKAITN